MLLVPALYVYLTIISFMFRVDRVLIKNNQKKKKIHPTLYVSSIFIYLLTKITSMQFNG